MQILCGLQVVFFLFNCQTPGGKPLGDLIVDVVRHTAEKAAST